MKSDVLTLISASASQRRKQRGGKGVQADQRRYLESIDEVAELARDVLMDKHLEISKVRPFFWTLVETYSDRFHSYPFDAFKALFSYLEMKDFPAEEMQEFVTRLERAFEERHGRPLLRKAGIPDEYATLDDEIRNLKDSLCYASLVDEELTGQD